MDDAEYHAARGEMQRLEAKPDRSHDEDEQLETLRKEIAAFEAGERSKGKPDPD